MTPSQKEAIIQRFKVFQRKMSERNEIDPEFILKEAISGKMIPCDAFKKIKEVESA
jgi:hypothetical protein